MARWRGLKHRGDEVGLREYLLEEAVAFREVYGRMAPEFWDALSPAVDALVGGEAYSFHRWALPDDGPLRLVRGPAGMGDVRGTRLVVQSLCGFRLVGRGPL